MAPHLNFSITYVSSVEFQMESLMICCRGFPFSNHVNFVLLCKTLVLTYFFSPLESTSNFLAIEVTSQARLSRTTSNIFFKLYVHNPVNRNIAICLGFTLDFNSMISLAHPGYSLKN